MSELAICLSFSAVVCGLAIWFVIDARSSRKRDREFWDAEWAKSETERARLREMVQQQHVLLLQKRAVDARSKVAPMGTPMTHAPVNGSRPRRQVDPMVLGNDDNTEG